MNKTQTEAEMTQTTCNTCCRPAHSPFRRHDDKGKIIHGCVDKFHTAAMTGVIGSTYAWHFRPEAKKIRAAEAAHLKALFSRKGLR